MECNIMDHLKTTGFCVYGYVFTACLAHLVVSVFQSEVLGSSLMQGSHIPCEKQMLSTTV